LINYTDVTMEIVTMEIIFSLTFVHQVLKSSVESHRCVFFFNINFIEFIPEVVYLLIVSFLRGCRET